MPFWVVTQVGNAINLSNTTDACWIKKDTHKGNSPRMNCTYLECHIHTRHLCYTRFTKGIKQIRLWKVCFGCILHAKINNFSTLLSTTTFEGQTVFVSVNKCKNFRSFSLIQNWIFFRLPTIFQQWIYSTFPFVCELDMGGEDKTFKYIFFTHNSYKVKYFRAWRGLKKNIYSL